MSGAFYFSWNVGRFLMKKFPPNNARDYPGCFMRLMPKSVLACRDHMMHFYIDFCIRWALESCNSNIKFGGGVPARNKHSFFFESFFASFFASFFESLFQSFFESRSLGHCLDAKNTDCNGIFGLEVIQENDTKKWSFRTETLISHFKLILGPNLCNVRSKYTHTI